MSPFDPISAIMAVLGLFISAYAAYLAYKSNKISQEANRIAEEAGRIVSESPAYGVGFSLEGLQVSGLYLHERVFKITIFNASTQPATNVELHLPTQAKPGNVSTVGEWSGHNPFSGTILGSNGRMHYPLAPLIPGKTKEVYIRTSTLFPNKEGDAGDLVLESERAYASQIWLSFTDSRGRDWLFDGIKHTSDDSRIPHLKVTKTVSIGN